MSATDVGLQLRQIVAAHIHPCATVRAELISVIATPAMEAQREHWRRLLGVLEEFINGDLSPPVFTRSTRNKLLALKFSQRQVAQLEAACKLSGCADPRRLAMSSEAARRLAVDRGFAARRGKRASPHLVAFVDGLEPVLLAMGVPRATGESARMVVVLREVYAQLGFKGDPRDQLRRRPRRRVS